MSPPEHEERPVRHVTPAQMRRAQFLELLYDPTKVIWVIDPTKDMPAMTTWSSPVDPPFHTTR
ncbi:hypothetical protein K1T35_48015 (plasmid) [Pseudonocardia sp. DSM 110487]|uniref:hypothetical protein n=1 Tax=Pseudonocardia sp. DSM 110487 TaxID=2865833 RepID=UPI001C69ABF8|nr:hypothetical protein [Pseudonocardia sp. DSM 110487]QYN41097.1 hypothetical protein K1T35_48015 [Pseudonocardia sp. DSM 110487]